MTSPVSRSTLKVSLFCLLGFTAFCLVVLEVTLNDQRLQVSHQRYSASQARSLQSDQSPANRSLPSADSEKTPSNSSGSSQLAGTGSKLSVGDVFRMFSRSSTTSATLPRPSFIDHCKESKATPVSNQTFSLDKQLLPNGTRPVSCNGCFNSDFPPLLENCGVCNTGVGKQSGQVEMVMVILTTHRAWDRRQAIRQTWASVTRNNTAHVRHVFLLGRVKDEDSMKKARDENARHGDVIMYDFMDSYTNLTLKTLTAMHWATRFCANARFLLKADDDMWVNVPNLLTIVRRENTTLHTAVGGACRMKAGPIRAKASKWYASPKAYPQKTYPGFCSGTTYVTSLNVARHVISVSPHVPFFYLEDVYVSLCIQRLGPPFRLKGLPGFFHGWSSPCVLRGEGTVTVHQVAPQKLRDIWNAKCTNLRNT